MRPPLFVRSLTESEQEKLEKALRSEEAFTLRRAQIVRLSSRGKRAPEIADDLGCSAQTVRNAIHEFNEEGIESLDREKPGPKDPDRIFGEEKREVLLELAHQSPREFSKERSTWTLELLAEVAFEEGLTERVVSHEAIRQAILEMGHSWQRAKDWIQSPDPQYALKKKQRDRLIRLSKEKEGWTLGFLDEVWWSRFAQPSMHAWARSGEPLRLVERETDSDEEEPKALACYGVYLPMTCLEEENPEEENPEEENPEEEDNATEEKIEAETENQEDEPDMLLRFVEGRPVSEVTTTFLKWICERLDERGTDVWTLVWDQASWHTSHEVQNWIQQHNQRVKEEGGVRILACQLPSKSPWLNPIEPKWLHGKRAICQPDGTLSPEDVIERVHAYYDCERVEPIPKETD